MIRTVAGLLDSLKQREMELIAQSGIRHAPTIGAQYEGLTTDLRRRMIPRISACVLFQGLSKVKSRNPLRGIRALPALGLRRFHHSSSAVDTVWSN